MIAWATREDHTGKYLSDVSPRRPLWQLMFGGVFDRQPDLKLVMTEVRADWLPATLRELDDLYLAPPRGASGRSAPLPSTGTPTA